MDAERRLAVARRRVPAVARRVRPRPRVVLEAAVRDERRLPVMREAAERRRPRLELERLLPVADLRAERDRDVALRVFAIGLASCRVRRPATRQELRRIPQPASNEAAPDHMSSLAAA